MEKSMSTGKVLPGIMNTGTLPKKLENFWASRVALVTIRRKSRRRATTCACEKDSASVKRQAAWR